MLKTLQWLPLILIVKPKFLQWLTKPIGPGPITSLISPLMLLPYQFPCGWVNTIKHSATLGPWHLLFLLPRTLFPFFTCLIPLLCLFCSQWGLLWSFKFESPPSSWNSLYPHPASFFSITVITICILYVLIICFGFCLHPPTSLWAMMVAYFVHCWNPRT